MANKPNDNTKNYIMLAMLRNKKFNEISIDWNNANNINWEQINQQTLSIENGLTTGLTLIGSEARESMYDEMCAMRDSVLSTYYATELTTQVKGEEKLRILHSCKEIIEGVDYLETLLQIHFPDEFPNELIQSVGFNKTKTQEGTSIVNEINEAVSTTTVEDLKGLTPNEPEDAYEDEVESIIPSLKQAKVNYQSDLIDGMDPGLATFLYETKKDLTENFTKMPEGFNNPEALLVNGMDPKLFHTLLEQREMRVNANAEQSTQNASVIDPTIVQ